VITSDFTEVPDPDSTLRIKRSFPPFARKRLVRVLRGRFCFDFGLAISCGGTFEINNGESKKLTLAPSYSGISIGGMEINRTIEETLSYAVGECDSIAPALCYSDSELHVYDCIANLGFGKRWSHSATEFFPNGRPKLHMNRIKNDAECGCVRDGADGSGSEELDLETALASRVSKVIRTTSFEADPDVTGESVDPDELTIAAANVFEEALAPTTIPQDVDPENSLEEMGVDSGIVNVDGSVTWFLSLAPAAGEGGTIPLSVVSIDCGAYLRRGLVVRSRQHPMPLLAFAPTTSAASATSAIYARLPGQNELQAIDTQRAAMHVARFTTVWTEVRLNELPDESEGFVEVQLFDHVEQPLGLPTRIAFRSEETPAVSAVPQQVSAQL